LTDTVKSWHVAYTEPKAEMKVEEELKRLNYATWLPIERRRKKIYRGRKAVIDWFPFALYPNYVFFGVRPEQGLYGAAETKGVSLILHSGETPLVVPHRVMDELMMRGDAEGVVRRIDEEAPPPARLFKRGARVMFTDASPLSGFLGTVAEDFEGGSAVRLWVDGFKSGKMKVDPGALVEAPDVTSSGI
jgi:transcription antitermination factor NusG